MWLQWQSKASRCLSLSHTAVLQPWPSAPPQITAECSVKPLQALQILCSNPLTGNAQTRGSPVWPCGYWLTISLLTPLSLSPPATSSENTREGGEWVLSLSSSSSETAFVWCANSKLRASRGRWWHENIFTAAAEHPDLWRQRAVKQSPKLHTAWSRISLSLSVSLSHPSGNEGWKNTSYITHQLPQWKQTLVLIIQREAEAGHGVIPNKKFTVRYLAMLEEITVFNCSWT